MAKKKVFISYEYDRDRGLRGDLTSQAGQQDSPFSISDVSLEENIPNDEWVSKARKAIRRCAVVIVLLGSDTYNAPGVQREVDIARGLSKRIFQLRRQGTSYGEVKGAGEVHVWTWKNLKELLA